MISPSPSEADMNTTGTPARFTAYITAATLAAVYTVSVTDFPDSQLRAVLAVAAVVLYLTLARTRSAGLWALLYTYTFVGAIVSLPWTEANSGNALRLAGYAAQVALLLTPTVRHGIRQVVSRHTEIAGT
jgi:hypothetical protein